MNLKFGPPIDFLCRQKRKRIRRYGVSACDPQTAVATELWLRTLPSSIFLSIWAFHNGDFFHIAIAGRNLMHNACNLVGLQECHCLPPFTRKIHTRVEVLNEIRLIINAFWCIKCVNKAWTDCALLLQNSQWFSLVMNHLYPSLSICFCCKLQKHSITHWNC